MRKYLDDRVIILEVLPPLLQVLQLSLRPVNPQLYSAREKEELKNLIDVMLAYNITYRQVRSLEGQYNYVTDPDVEAIASFPGVKQHKQFTYAAKHLIAREVNILIPTLAIPFYLSAIR